jgi:hypothetical protein
MHSREFAITIVGAVLGELFGPLSLPPDEYFPDRNKIDVSALGGNECAVALITAAALDGADFAGEDYAGLLSVLEAAVALVERYEMTAG